MKRVLVFDIDGDGILQEFEDMAMDLINPRIWNSEDEEIGLSIRASCGEICPSISLIARETSNTNMLFIALPGSKSYGRAGIAGHDGDVRKGYHGIEVTSEKVVKFTI